MRARACSQSLAKHRHYLHCVQRQLAVQLASQPPNTAPNLVVCSYEHLRADVEWAASIPWLYCGEQTWHAQLALHTQHS